MIEGQKEQSVKTRSSIPGFLRLAVVLAMAGPFVTPSWAGDSPSDSRWLPWLGCWELRTQRAETEDEPAEDLLICLSPEASADAVKITTLAEMESVRTDTIVADGVLRPVEEPGCSGWRSAEWSRDGRRLFMKSELLCEKYIKRMLSGAAFVDASGIWVDVQLLSSGSRRELLVRRYRRVSAEETEAAGFAEPALDRPESRWARAALGAPLLVPDVVEAVSKVRPEVLEAVLVEAGKGFDLDGATLLKLARDEVPRSTIDLMVALSYPAAFRVDRLGGAESAQASNVSPDGGLGGYTSWYPAYLAPFAFWHSDYDRAYYYDDDYYDYGGEYWVLPPEGVTQPSHGRVVQGQGYTRISPHPRTGEPGGYSASSGGYSTGTSSSSGTASSSGYSQGGDGGSTGRTAHVRE
jgi:hypothetical protein